MGLLADGADLANVGLTALNNYTNRQFAREQATTAYNRQLALLENQRAYDSPSAQMDRFVKAGLNPNLIYGQLGNGLNAPTAPQGFAANNNDPQLILQNRMMEKQIERMDIQNNNEIKKTEQDVKESLSRMGANDANAAYLAGLTTTIPVSIHQMEQQINLMSKQSIEISWNNAIKSATFHSTVDSIAANARVDKARAANIGRYWTSYFLGQDAQSRKLLSDIRLNEAHRGMIVALGDLYKSQTEAQNIENMIQKTPITVAGVKGTVVEWRAINAAKQNAWGSLMHEDIYQFQHKMTQLYRQYGSIKEFIGLVKDASIIFDNTLGNLLTPKPSLGKW